MCISDGWLVHMHYLAIHIVMLTAGETLTFLLMVLNIYYSMVVW